MLDAHALPEQKIVKHKRMILVARMAYLPFVNPKNKQLRHSHFDSITRHRFVKHSFPMLVAQVGNATRQVLRALVRQHNESIRRPVHLLFL